MLERSFEDRGEVKASLMQGGKVTDNCCQTGTLGDGKRAL